MISNLYRNAELYRINYQPSTFGEAKEEVKIDNIIIALMERSVTYSESNYIATIDYDVVGITTANPLKNDIIKVNNTSYVVKSVQHSRRYNQVFMREVI